MSKKVHLPDNVVVALTNGGEKCIQTGSGTASITQRKRNTSKHKPQKANNNQSQSEASKEQTAPDYNDVGRSIERKTHQ